MGRDRRPEIGPQAKPGPRPRKWYYREGLDYYCGRCVGHLRIVCDFCVDGCAECSGGYVECPECLGGTLPVPPPEWLPDTPRPPRCHHAEPGELPVSGGAGRVEREASRLVEDPTGES